MPVRESGPERVNAFLIGDRYLFRHYFDGDAVFDRLKPYYEHDEYRFAVPPRRFEQIQAFLADRDYDLRVVDDPAPFVVVVRKYRSHPENVFKAAVHRWSTPNHNCFLLRDEGSVETAVRSGATRLPETSLSVSFADGG
ncbi:hypothetical protein GCM10027435_16600 [Haloparvum alkalitolerans]|uniref:hypothetical protein n=1 Tax=Haloparvum alkalitolerans TaxID=1042953 RepID=UPI003CE9998E